LRAGFGRYLRDVHSVAATKPLDKVQRAAYVPAWEALAASERQAYTRDAEAEFVAAVEAARPAIVAAASPAQLAEDAAAGVFTELGVKVTMPLPSPAAFGPAYRAAALARVRRGAYGSLVAAARAGPRTAEERKRAEARAAAARHAAAAVAPDPKRDEMLGGDLYLPSDFDVSAGAGWVMATAMPGAEGSGSSASRRAAAGVGGVKGAGGKALYAARSYYDEDDDEEEDDDDIFDDEDESSEDEFATSPARSSSRRGARRSPSAASFLAAGKTPTSEQLVGGKSKSRAGAAAAATTPSPSVRHRQLGLRALDARAVKALMQSRAKAVAEALRRGRDGSAGAEAPAAAAAASSGPDEGAVTRAADLLAAVQLVLPQLPLRRRIGSYLSAAGGQHVILAEAAGECCCGWWRLGGGGGGGQ
jgi:hypothetical protein